jgi:hypothetical protein
VLTVESAHGDTHTAVAVAGGCSASDRSTKASRACARIGNRAHVEIIRIGELFRCRRGQDVSGLPAPLYAVFALSLNLRLAWLERKVDYYAAARH